MDNLMYLIINIVGIAVFLGIMVLISKKRRQIPWISIVILLAINIVLAWFFLTIPAGQAAITGATNGFAALIRASQDGVTFAFSDALSSTGKMIAANGTTDTEVIKNSFVFFASALLPVIVIVPLFDILTYFGILPFIIKIIGKAVAVVTREPKFESFYAIEMMFLGNTEAIAVSRFQLVKLNKERNLTIAMMSMSCVTASLIGAYTQMLPGQYILTAIPLNVINALLCTSILNPVKVDKREDTIVELYQKGEKKESFFSFLGGSILNSGTLVLIIVANVIAFVGLASVINLLLGLFDPLFEMAGLNFSLSLQNILGIVMYIPACLMGMPFGDPETLELAQSMGTKLVMNEFVVMGQLQPTIAEHSTHFQCVATVFMTSFANFSTLGMVLGAMKGVISEQKNTYIAKNILYMFLSGILVSCMSASIAGVFVW